jgi:hypothetical protein
MERVIAQAIALAVLGHVQSYAKDPGTGGAGVFGPGGEGLGGWGRHPA